MLHWSDKDPSETIDYYVDWSVVLVTGDTIKTSAWSLPSGLTSTGNTFAGTQSVVWVGGGTTGQQYILSCTITTNLGRTYTQGVALWVRPQ